MRNAEEHKKLLEQIAALERNSVNYFDVEKEFFLIDSENLSQVQTRFYGYSIQADGIYEEDNLTEAAVTGLDGRGCYVYVEVKDGQITIKQDLNGCWGIYLFRHGDYFALSNSFFRLLDHIKFRYPLTVNRDYCYHILLINLCSHACLETAINEIRLVERNVIFHIDISKKSYRMDFIDYRENSISPDSEGGIALLDKWFELWNNVLRGLAQHTQSIKTDLSGGFDSRISLVPLLNSGIDLDKIQIFSRKKDEVQTYKEDYDIASQIVEHYGLKLNQPLSNKKFLNYSLSDVCNIDLYHRQTFEKTPFINTKKIYLLQN